VFPQTQLGVAGGLSLRVHPYVRPLAYGAARPRLHASHDKVDVLRDGRAVTEEQVAASIQRAARGEQSACRELYQRFHASVRRVALGYSALGPAEVEDVVQETFARAFRELPRLQHPRAFGRWLVTIARHHAQALSRGAQFRARATEDLAHQVDVAAPAVPPSLELERRVAVVRALIEGLPEGPEKETARLFYLEGELSAREIADRLGLGKSAVTMRLERFRARVKRELLARLLAAEVE
jgi:RNA polymerase sigma-70 factor (ECF subfamily)